MCRGGRGLNGQCPGSRQLSHPLISQKHRLGQIQRPPELLEKTKHTDTKVTGAQLSYRGRSAVAGKNTIPGDINQNQVTDAITHSQAEDASRGSLT